MAKFVNRFVISDTHFGHENVCTKFKNADGSPLRPFASAAEMDEAMVERWNAKVSPHDTVYHLGDVVIAKRHLETVKRLNGRKILIRGNHDIMKDRDYYDAGFEQIHGVRVFVDKFIMSHIPLHPDCVTDRFKVNLHGHLHGNEVMRRNEKVYTHIDPQTYEPSVRSRKDHNVILDESALHEPDPRYMSVCVEKTDFAPLHFDEIEARIKKRWEDTGYVGPTNAWGNGSGPG